MRKPKKVAVVHDWLTGMRGGEAVLEAILELYPDADLFTLLHNPGTVSEFIENRKITTSFIDRLPFKSKKYRWYLPLFPTAIELFDFHGYDLIVSSSHCVARGIIPPPHVPHVCYFHSPMRYVWDLYHEYFPAGGFANRFIIPFFANYLRMWDASARDRVDAYVCNSAFVAERIRRYYGKTAAVVPPPCIPDEAAIQIPALESREDFYLIVSAFVPYKRLDLAIEACLKRGAHLKIVGKGPEDKNLRRLADEKSGNGGQARIEFLGHATRLEILDLYSRASALLFPGEEDFGIVPVEAQARGCPVVAYGSGGALETVLGDRNYAAPYAAKKDGGARGGGKSKKKAGAGLSGTTGVFFPEQSAAAMNEALDRHEKIRYRARDFQRNVARFTAGAFQAGMIREINGAERT
ncbi:MAG: glycosyltransferase [bacterium]|nr:glycosyltransferase [bacterium]